jgi:uncharacterized caspase-like protein
LATPERVRTSAAALAALARGNDDVILYFSGLGWVEEDGTPALVLFQSGLGRVERIALPDLLDILLANKPRTLTMILDCSFTAPGDRRCATAEATLTALSSAGVTGSLLDRVVERVEQAGTRCVVLSASDAVIGSKMPALEIEELTQGLFTSFALQGLNGAANTDGVAGVTVEEFEKWMRERVTHIAQLEGASQTGWYHAPGDLQQLALPANVGGISRSAGGGD